MLKRYLPLALILLAIPFLDLSGSERIRPEGACVPDVQAAFAAISRTGTEKFPIQTRDRITGRAYTMALWNKLGLDNHFQGVQTLPDPRYIAISGANIHTKQAHLFIAKVNHTEEEPRLVKTLVLGDQTLWHAGGMSRHGSILVVPVEAYKISKTSAILFFDVKNPEEPELVLSLDRPHFDAGATALTRLEDGHWLLIAYSNGIYEFYRSHSPQLADGFPEAPDARRDWSFFADAKGSSLNFIDQCDGKKFLITFRNTGKAPPKIWNGKDLAGLLAFDWNGGSPLISILGQKHVICHAACNFAGAAGARVTQGGELELYSTSIFRKLRDGRLRMKFFSSEPAAAAKK